MKKRPIWMGCLLAVLFCFAVLARRMDAMRFQGLQVKSEEQLRQMTENLSDVSGTQNMDELIELDGKMIPYDRIHNTFYVSQSMREEAYAGIFRAVGEQCSVYLQEDAARKDKKAAIMEGHIFRLWFVMGEKYAVADLIFTGLPMIGIRSDAGGLTQNYGRGDIVVQNPDDEDVITMSIKDSDVQVKMNYHSGTISVKLYKQDYQEERNLSLLGLGKHTSWKLYPVHDRDESAFRELLSAYVWNSVCEDERLARSMEYAEIIVDGEYKGLYYLAPKSGKGYLGLGEEDRLYKVEKSPQDDTAIYTVAGDEEIDKNRQALEEYLSLWENDNRDFQQLNVENYTSYYIWLQVVCGIQSSTEDYCVIAYKNGNGEYEFCRAPERSKFVFGIYPSEKGWQSMTAAESIMGDMQYERLMEASDGTLEKILSDKWRELRDSALDTEAMQHYAGQCEKRLIESGYIVRSGNQEEYETDCREVKEFIERRMNYLDGCYN